jgi:PAS domain S-box-containing protein
LRFGPGQPLYGRAPPSKRHVRESPAWPHLQDQLLNCIDLLLDAVFLVDADGRIKYVNAACERIFGYTPDELIGAS